MQRTVTFNMAVNPELYYIIPYGRGMCVLVHGSHLEAKRDDWGHVYYDVPDSATVRRWGTSHGLSQLCAQGPQDSTKLDSNPCRIIIPMAAVHDMRECHERTTEAWTKALTAARLELLGGSSED